MRITHSSGGTPRVGPGAVQRWVDLLDAAERGLCWADPHDANAQRTAGRRIESLFLYEHQMTPPARRRARETVWNRHHPGQNLPEALHAPDELAPAPGCVCANCRRRWEQCSCRSCRRARLFRRPAMTAPRAPLRRLASGYMTLQHVLGSMGPLVRWRDALQTPRHVLPRFRSVRS